MLGMHRLFQPGNRTDLRLHQFDATPSYYTSSVERASHSIRGSNIVGFLTRSKTLTTLQMKSLSSLDQAYEKARAAIFMNESWMIRLLAVGRGLLG